MMNALAAISTGFVRIVILSFADDSPGERGAFRAVPVYTAGLAVTGESRA
jgi:hypothetical protein